MIRLSLYHTAGCHLCEQAEERVLACLAARGMDPAACLRRTDIADDGELLERYGVLIPVLREEASGRELNWPFGPEEIQSLL